MSPIIRNALGPDHHNRQGTQILARTLYKELRANGCDPDQILAICTQMLDEVTTELKVEEPQAAAPAA